MASISDATSHFGLRKKWSDDNSKQKPSLPSYRKDRKTDTRPFDLIPIKAARAYAIDLRDVSIVLPRDRRRAYGSATGRLNVPYRGRRLHIGKSGRAEVKWDAVRKRWYFAWAVELPKIPERDGGPSAAVDLGVRIGASLSIEGVAQAMHFENREVMKIWDWLGREIAREQSHIAGTRGPQPENRAPHSRGLSMLHAKRAGRLEHAQRCIAKAVAARCAASGVTMVYLGHPKNILRDVRYGTTAWAGRIHNFWSFDKMLGYLECALGGLGIASARVGERGSSSKCPQCHSLEVVRSPRWRLRCKSCGSVMHSDQAGSRNILRMNRPSASWAGAEAAPLTETSRWDRHLWTPRSADPKRGDEAPEFLAVAA